ncbi:MAG: 2-(1,2-epoxy,2-dihydrophenyl)acetyl-CoA isomerase [Acidimicrobiaceae bacterium]|nr:2-(1,2-epoxy,2-dihydrophenyl)acetyl-CoA isomerase [Acidimicrobiaceae bacterium]
MNVGRDRTRVRYERRDEAAWITMVLGDSGNPLTHELADDLLEATRQARRDNARVVVLRAEGKAFCVGGDLQTFGSTPDPGVYIDDLAEALHRLVSELGHLDAPVVSVVQGVAAGAGFPIAMAADIVLAGRSARFTLAYTNAGLTPDGGSSLLTSTVGLHQAMYLALMNPVLSADQAHQVGLVAEVHDDDALDEAAERVVARLVNGSATALTATKRLFRDRALPDAEAAMRRESLSVRAAANSHDGREGVRAFLAKRAPRFQRQL